MSKPSTLTLKNILTPTSTKRRRHPSIGCHQYDLEVDDGRCREFHAYAGEALREAYVDPEYLATVLEREGFSGVAKLLEEKFPSEDNPFSVRTGDFGEVVGHIVLLDIFDLTIPVFKLRFKTNWEKAAFGIDIIAFRLHDEGHQKDAVVFAEVKTSKDKDYGVEKVFEEIESLVAEGQSEAKNKMRNAVRFVSERLFEQQQYELEQRIYRFLDCYTKPHYVEAFLPLLVRDKRTWGEDALDGIVLDKLDPNRVVLCTFLIGDLEEAVRTAYEMAAKVGDEIG
jgi:hypothetical protein